MYTYDCKIFVLLPTFLFVQSTLRQNIQCSGKWSPGGHVGPGLGAIRALWSAWQALKVFFPAGVDKTISLVSIREAFFCTYVPLKCRHFFGPSCTRSTYRYVFLRLNTTHNTDNRQPNTAAEQRAWLTPAAYSTATLSSSSSSTVISHGHVWQVYMLLYYCCGYLFFSDPRSIIPQQHTSLSASSTYCCVWSNTVTAPAVLDTVRQQQQVAYYAHVADPRCTLSTTASSGVCCCCLRHIGLCTYLLHAVCDRHFLLRTDHPRIAANHSYKHRVQQHSYKNTLSYGLLCALHCWPILEPAERAPVHVPLSQYAYLMLSYHITWHFKAVLLYIHAVISCDVF